MYIKISSYPRYQLRRGLQPMANCT